MTPAPLQLGQAPSELALNRAGFTPLAFANALRIGSSSPVYVAGLLRREPLIEPWSIATTPSLEDTERDVDVDVLQVVGVGAAHLQRTRGRPHRRLQIGLVVQVSPGERAAGPQPVDGALEHHFAACGSGARTEIDGVIRDHDR